MQLRAVEQLYLQLHDEAPFHDGSFKRWSKKRSFDFPYRADEGVAFWLAETDVNPDDDFLGRGLAAEQPNGNVDQRDDGHQAT